MEPALHQGQLVFTTRLRRGDSVRRSELVIVDSLELRRRIIKRVIGLPGDEVRLRGGLVYVNDTPISEPYAARSVFNGLFRVPEGHYFLLGDNRDESSDSRSWVMPYISRDQIKGRLHLLTLPAGRPGNGISWTDTGRAATVTDAVRR